MWIETPVFQEDLKTIAQADCIPWEQLRGKTCLITGATGLIGYTLTSALLYAGWKKQLDLTVVALVRNVEKAKQKFAAQLSQGLPLRFVQGDVEHLPPLDGPVDYVIHGASPTASKYFVEHPVETIHTAVIGTMNLMRLAKDKQCQGFVYLSSMEVYGSVEEETPLQENDLGYLNPLAVRSCYPESKRLCEALCAANASEYNLRAMSVRLAQTFGPGVDANDNRAFAEFMRCARQGREIVLQTPGDSKQPYIYTTDAASAILTVLLKGEKGQAYNAVNSETYCSIAEMARLVADHFSKEQPVAVKIAASEESMKKYPPKRCWNLSAYALTALGWEHQKDLVQMYQSMICAVQ